MYSGCRRTAQFNSDFCYKHRNEISQKTTNSHDIPTDDGFDIGNQVIKFEIDGKKKTINSKEIDTLLSRLKRDKKFWIVDLTVDENEFVQYAIEKGITNVHDAWQSPDMINAIIELVEEKKMPLRCYGMIGASFKDYIKTFFNKGHHLGTHYKIRSVKAFIDGALGSRGAALHEPYSDDHCNCG